MSCKKPKIMSKSRQYRLSLTWRLIGCYSLGCLLTLTAAGLFLRENLRKNLERQDIELLTDHVASLRNTIAAHPTDAKIAASYLIDSCDKRKINRICGRMIDGENQLIFSAPDMEKMAPPITEFPQPSECGAPPTIERRGTMGPDKAAMFLLSQKVTTTQDEQLLYQAMFVSSHIAQWMKNYDRAMILTIIVGTLSSALLGWGVAHNGLLPLRRIGQAFQRVTANEMNERVGAQPWPKELASLAQEFDHMLQRLQQSFNHLSQFTADAAHEFRTPLNNLMGATSLMLSKDRSAEQYRALLQSNIEQYTRLNRMVESLLFLARADHSAAGFRLQPVQASDCVRGVLEFFSAMADESDVSLHMKGDAIVMADESMLRIALCNLVSNGLRYTPPGKSLSIEISQDAKQQVILSVIDSGTGIAPEHFAHIFDRYYRVEQSRSTAGAGLGLSLVQTIMKLHGGLAQLESAPGAGAKFSLVFPAQRQVTQ
jgi:two-component system heavy metal sensor histidine kinase CusS